MDYFQSFVFVGHKFSDFFICVDRLNHHVHQQRCVMRKSRRNKAGKRKKNNSECNSSGDGDNPSHFKLSKPRGSSAEEDDSGVSDILKRQCF